MIYLVRMVFFQFANCYMIRVYSIFVSFSQGIYCKHQAMGISCRKYGCYMIDKVMVAWWLLLVDGTIYLDDQNHNKTSKPRNKAPMHQMTFCTIGWNWNPISAKGGFFLGLQHQLHEFSASQFHQQVGFKGNQLDIAEPWQSILAATKEVQPGSSKDPESQGVWSRFLCCFSVWIIPGRTEKYWDNQGTFEQLDLSRLRSSQVCFDRFYWRPAR